MLGSVWALIEAFYKGVVAFCSPQDFPSKWCEQGHILMTGWPHCPQCRWHEVVCKRVLESQASSCPAWVLIGFDGPLSGEFMQIHQNRTLVGLDVSNDRVLTVASAFGSQTHWPQYELKLDEKTQQWVLCNSERSEQPTSFKVNQVGAVRDFLFDYDQLELMGTRFLVLRVSAFADAGM